MKKLLSVIVSVMLCSQLAFAAIESRGLISVDFQGTTLQTVLNVLAMKTGRKFVTDSNLLNKRIVLSLKDVTPDEALNALLDTYDLYYVKQGDTNIYVIKSKNDISPITVSKVIFCNYAKADNLCRVLEARLTKGGKIVADERTNALVITDLADSIDKMEVLIRTLDVPTPQVQIESRIVDVTLSDQIQIGTQINNIFRMKELSIDNILIPTTVGGVSYEGGYQSSESIGTGQYAIKDVSKYVYASPLGVADGITTPLVPRLNYTQGLTSEEGIADTTGRISFATVLGSDLNVLGSFYAGAQNQNAKIITNPKLIVLNNSEATIDIVEQIPYTTDRTVSDNGTVTQSIDFKEVGLKLKVKPQINRDGTIVIDVEPEQSFRTGEVLSNTPIISTSKSKTTLILRSGETAVIGGLIREAENETVVKVPLLGDIPLLGYLFKSSTKQKERHELTIFISAKIVN